MAPNSTPCRSRSVAVAALILFTGCSSFFKLTPEGEATPASAPTKPVDKPAAKAPDKVPEKKPDKPKAEPEKVATAKPTPAKGKVAVPPAARTPEPIAPPMEIVPPEPEPVASDSAGLARLRILASVWQTVALYHPYIASRGIAWDSALVRAIPAVRAARNDAQFVAAIDKLLSALGDPLTRVERDSVPNVGARQSPVRADVTPDGVLVLTLPAHAEFHAQDSLVVARAMSRVPERVVIDLRNDFTALPAESSALLDAFAQNLGIARSLTSTPLLAPTERVRRIGPPSSARVGRPFGEGGDSWLERDAVVVEAAARVAPRVVIMANRTSALPRTLMALWSAGRATLVVEGTTANTIDDGALVATDRIAIANDIVVRVRLGELVHADGTTGIVADTVVAPAVSASDTAPALRAALQVVRTARAPRAKRAAVGAAPMATLPIAMDNQNYPTMGARLLAGFRLWSAMRARHANRDLYDDDVDAVFARVLPKLESARNEQQYAAAIGDLASALDDAAGVLRGPSVQTWLGTSSAPFRLRYVEGRALITDVVHDTTTTALALAVGTEITAADGFPLPAWMSEHRRIGAASNEWTRNREQMRAMPLGPEGPALFKVRDATGKERSINIPRRASYNALLPQVQRPDAAPSRRLDGNTGYIDVERFTESTIDSAYSALKDTRALILDLRTDTIAPNVMDRLLNRLASQSRYVRTRETVRYSTKPCANLPLRLVAAACPDERVERVEWANGDAQGRYRGRVVLLIDERTQGVAERLALALESATTASFVGSPSAGAASPAVALELPGALTVGIPVIEVRRVDGGQLQRVGITPNVDVRPTVKGIRNHQDEVIERAQQWLVQQLDPPVRRKR